MEKDNINTFKKITFTIENYSRKIYKVSRNKCGQIYIRPVHKISREHLSWGKHYVHGQEEQMS